MSSSRPFPWPSSTSSCWKPLSSATATSPSPAHDARAVPAHLPPPALVPSAPPIPSVSSCFSTPSRVSATTFATQNPVVDQLVHDVLSKAEAAQSKQAGKKVDEGPPVPSSAAGVASGKDGRKRDINNNRDDRKSSNVEREHRLRSRLVERLAESEASKDSREQLLRSRLVDKLVEREVEKAVFGSPPATDRVGKKRISSSSSSLFPPKERNYKASVFYSSSPKDDESGGRENGAYKLRDKIFPADVSAIKRPPPSASRRGGVVERWLSSPDVSPYLKTPDVKGKNRFAVLSSAAAAMKGATRKRDAVITLDLEDDDEERDADAGKASSDGGRLRRSARRQKDHEVFVNYKNACVSLYDYRSLEDEEYVNDAVIDFYLLWLHENKLDASRRDDVHIFNSHFYSKLTSRPLKTSSGADGSDEAPKSQAARAYECVKNWTKKVDLFQKQMIVVPICEEAHWYVILICNAGSITKSAEDRVIAGKPYFLVLDSLGETHPNAVSALRKYLAKELQQRKGKSMNFSAEKMPVKTPSVPNQTNSCDCGVFLLHYVELIFANPTFFLFPSKVSKEMSDWFCEGEIQHKREDIANLVRSYAEEGTEFPELKFVERKNKRKRKKEEGQATSAAEKMETGAPETNGDETEEAEKAETGVEKEKEDEAPLKKKRKEKAREDEVSKKEASSVQGRKEQEPEGDRADTPEELARRLIEGSDAFKDVKCDREKPERAETVEAAEESALFQSPKKAERKRRKRPLDVEVVRSERSSRSERVVVPPPKDEVEIPERRKNGAGVRPMDLEDGEIDEEEVREEDDEQPLNKMRRPKARKSKKNKKDKKDKKKKKDKKAKKKRKIEEVTISSSSGSSDGGGDDDSMEDDDVTTISSGGSDSDSHKYLNDEAEDSTFVVNKMKRRDGPRRADVWRRLDGGGRESDESFDRTNPLLTCLHSQQKDRSPKKARESAEEARSPPRRRLAETDRRRNGCRGDDRESGRPRRIRLVRNNLDPEEVTERPGDAVRMSLRLREDGQWPDEVSAPATTLD